MDNGFNRREFMRKSGGAAAFTVAASGRALSSEANSRINVGVIGTGGRGRYDAGNLLKTGKAQIVALADYFDFQMEDPARMYNVEADKCFAGIDGYKELIALDEVDAVVLTTAPYFRPMQFAEAVNHGKHVFAEKPVAVDPWGCRSFMDTGAVADQKGLTVVAGLQGRYDEGRRKIARMIHGGAIGDPVVGHSTRMGGDLWRRPRPDHFTERDHQIRHWLYYLWASGDFIVEMHVHNLDVFNWFTGMLPVSAHGKGGRAVRLDVGDIFDHIAVEYEYPAGFYFTHTGTQIPTGYSDSVKQIIGTEGSYDEDAGLYTKEKERVEHGGVREATMEEMIQFADSVLGEIPRVNNTDYVVTSTFTCILGREAAYRNETVTWDELWNSYNRIEMPV